MKMFSYEEYITQEKFKVKDKVFYRQTCSFCGNIVEFFHGEKPSTCPHCNKENYIKPFTETRLFLLQKKFLESGSKIKYRNKQILSSMYQLLMEYSQSIVKKELPNTFTHHYEKVEEKAHDAVNLIISQFLEKEDFKIEVSFGGLLKFKVREVLFAPKIKKEECHESIHHHITEGIEKEILEASDILNIENISSPNNTQSYFDYELTDSYKVQLLEKIKKLFDKIISELKTNFNIYYVLLTVIGILVWIKKSGDMEEFYDNFGTESKDLIDKSMVFFYEMLQEN